MTIDNRQQLKRVVGQLGYCKLRDRQALNAERHDDFLKITPAISGQRITSAWVFRQHGADLLVSDFLRARFFLFAIFQRRNEI